MVGDKISELIISLKNASMVSKDNVTFDYSKLYESILKVLDEKNFIESLEVSKDKKSILVTLKYDEKGKTVITDVKRISKLSKRVYKGSKEIRRVKNGFGVAVISTPLGILSDEDARENGVGGELMFEIW
jgi:small subunit ribosomal protein S8